MGLLLWIVFGAIVGWIASAVMGSNGTLVQDVIIGIVGATIGGFIMSFFGESGVTSFNLYSFIVAIFGACVLIAAMRAFRT